jgi:hypothetical protein
VISLLNANETVFFSHVEGCLRQWVDLRLSNDSVNEISTVLTITAGGEAVETRLLILSGDMIYRAYAPVQWPRPPEESWLNLRTDEQQLETRICLGHYRPWTVYLLSDVCTDYVWAYDAEESMRADDAALTKAELDAGTHYNFVHSREIEFFLEHYPDQAERLFNALGRGQMTLNPVLNMSLYGCMSLEEIIRSFYPARRLARQQGLTDVYANIQETPTAPWILPTLLVNSGIHHLIRSSLPYECPWAHRLAEPPLYSWQGPDSSRVLVRFRNQDCVEGNFVLKGLKATNIALHNEILPRYAALGPAYPFDAIGLVGCYGDLSPNSRHLPKVKAATVEAYNTQGWEYPRLVDAAHWQFWEDVDSQIQARSIQVPVLCGDYGSSWEAWPACLASDFAAWRRAQERAQTADRLSAILSRLDPAWYADQRSELEHGWKALLSLADHAWNGAFERNRELNARLRRGWQIEANRTFDRLIDSGLEALGRQIPTQNPGLMVFNALGWGRNGLVRLTGELPAAVRDVVSGNVMPVQQASEGNQIAGYFLAEGLPSVGYRMYTVETQPLAASGQRTVIAQDNCLDGPFYRIEIHPATGAIASLYDKTRQRELVDPTSAYGLNEAVYLSTTELSIKPAPYQLFQGIDLSGMNEQSARLVSMAAGNCGPIFGELVVRRAIGDIQITTFLRLYHHLNRVDIRNEVEKPVTVEKQELDFIFPFNVPERQYRVEAPGAILTPGADQRPGAGQAVQAVRHFVDVFNRDYGVILSMADSGLVEFGHRTTGEDPLEPDPTNATLFCVALENTFDWNEAIHNQGGATHFVFRYSLRGHEGNFDPLKALHFAWEDNNEPLTIYLPAHNKGSLPADQHSFLSVTPDHAVITGFRPADGEGLILRLWEITGQPVNAQVEIAGLGSLTHPVHTDLLETYREPLQCVAGKPILPIKGSGVEAIRLV